MVKIATQVNRKMKFDRKAAIKIHVRFCICKFSLQSMTYIQNGFMCQSKGLI